MIFAPDQVKFGYAKTNAARSISGNARFLRLLGRMPENRLLRTRGRAGTELSLPGLKRFSPTPLPE